MENAEDKLIVRKVLLLHVGGTIGMTRNQIGILGPEANVFREKLMQNSQLHDDSCKYLKLGKRNENILALPLFADKYRILYEIKEFTRLLDSSNAGVESWKKIALKIYVKDHYSDYDGFVITHGTDTLAYTASALSFMFDNLQKPIIFTGSQLPISDPRSDGVTNLEHALIFAGAYHIAEVCIFFGRFLLRGNRAVKISAESFDAFQSPNMEPLARVGCEINLKLEEDREHSKEKCTLHMHLNTNVNILMIFPDISENMVKSAFAPPIDGVLLLTYGSGNIPLNKKYITEAVKEATSRGVLVVNCTQCLKGCVKLIYETNKVLTDCGAVSAFDMTVEAAFTKLMYVLSMDNLNYSKKVKMLENNLRGELTK